MCRWSYVYYPQCQHGELTRLDYCETAIRLGLPEKHDRLRLKAQQPDKDNVQPAVEERSVPHGISDTLHSAAESRPTSSLPTSPKCEQGHSTENMSTALPPGVVPARSWAQVASGQTEKCHPVEQHVPRSVHAETDVIGHAEQSQGSEHHLQLSQDTSSLDTTDYNNLNINIPLDTYSGFSMKLTHDNGKVQEIVTRFESLSVRDRCDGPLSDDIRVPSDPARPRAMSASTAAADESDTDTDTLHGFPIGRGAHPTSGSASIGRASYGPPSSKSDIEQFSPPTSALESSKYAHASRGKGTLSRKSAMEMARNVDTHSPDTDYHEPQSPRKPIPARWTGKTQGPALATAQRAMARESRKGASQDTAAATTRKTFLTKAAAEAVENDVASSNTLKRTSSSIGPSTSRTSPTRHGGSPVRGSPKREPNIQITVSPTRPAWGSVHTISSSSKNLKVEHSRKHSHAPSSVSSIGGYVTARQSPVSSAQSFAAALSQLRDDVPELELANGDDHLQKASHPSGTKPHSRGKSEPQAKVSPLNKTTTTTKPTAPKLSLRIPHSSSQSTNLKSPLTAGSGSTSGTGTPVSPAASSRIPRISSSAKGEPTGLTRSRSTKSLPSKATTAATPQHRKPESTDSSELGEACTTPLPETPAVTNIRHVRTVNSEGVTPILSDEHPAQVQAAESVKRSHEPPVTAEILTDSSSDETVKSFHTGPEPSLDSVVPSAESARTAVPKETIVSSVRHQFGMLQISESVHMSPLDGPVDRIMGHVTGVAEYLEEEDEKSKEAQQRFQRTASWASDATVASEATIRAAPRDPVLEDTAVIYSRRKSDSTDTNPDTMAHPAQTAAGRGSDTDSATMPMSSLSKFPQSDVHQHRKTPSESSLLSTLTSGLRAEAAEFVPQQQSATNYSSTMPLPHQNSKYARPAMPAEWSNLHAESRPYQAVPAHPTVPFDPFGLDTYGRPLYHLMYPVSIGPGTQYDLSCYRPHTRSPKKGRKKRQDGTPRQGQRQSQDEHNDQSPTKAPAVETSKPVVSEGGDNEPTPRPKTATPVADVLAALDASSAPASTTQTDRVDPFSTQMEELTYRAADLVKAGRPKEPFPANAARLAQPALGRAPLLPPRDPTFEGQIPSLPPRGPRGGRLYEQGLSPSIPPSPGLAYPPGLHNAGFGTLPSNFNTLPASMGYPGAGTRGGDRHRYSNSRSEMFGSPGNGLYDAGGPRRGGRGYRYRGWNASPGVPLDATAPFPNPVAPPGPQRSVVEPPGLQRSGAVPEARDGSGAEGGANGGAGAAKEYVGYAIEEKEKAACGQMVIDQAMEWGGSMCNACEPDH